MSKTRDEVTSWLLHRLNTALDLRGKPLDPHADLARYGLESLTAVEVAAELSDWLEARLPDDLLWKHRSVAALVEALAQRGLCTEGPAAESGV